MKRRDFLKHTLASGAILLVPITSSCTAQELSITKALDLIQTLKSAPSLRSQGTQTPFQIFMHCTQSIDCALQGYPEMKPAWFQNSIGKAAFHAFSLMDHMKHDVNAPIPGLAAPAADGDVYEALARLEQSFRSLQTAAVIKPHFFFGELSHSDMERAQVMHLFNHLETLQWKDA